MSKRIREAFSHGKAFIPFVTAGDPSLEVTARLVPAMAAAGADLIELGIPFSDPVAEGPVIQQADERAAQVVARPGTSEHNLGLACDIVALDYQNLDDGYAETPEAKWLYENCAKYGFILRYPPDKEDITGVIYEPWHFRYVGEQAAQEIMQRGICLEEYLES